MKNCLFKISLASHKGIREYIYIYISYLHLFLISVLNDVISELRIPAALDHGKFAGSQSVRAGYTVTTDSPAKRKPLTPSSSLFKIPHSSGA